MKRTMTTLSCLLLLAATPYALASDSHEHGNGEHGHDSHEEEINLDAMDDHPEGDHDHESEGHGEKGHKEAGHKEGGHDHGAGGHEEGGAIELDARSIKAAGIQLATVKMQPYSAEITAPGEVRLNAYHTSHITPRIAGQITARHARLGDTVKQGQPLVTLSSIEMAEAQGTLLVAQQEWQRVKKMGRNVVSARRYAEADIGRAQAQARVRAFGMTQKQVDALLRTPDPALAIGTFDLLSPQAGTVISDEFVLGEVAEPGRQLLTVTDESSVWVEAHLAPADAVLATPGAAAQVRLEQVSGQTVSLPGTVTQVQHQVDEATRTFPVRIRVNNLADTLHPGMFVEVAIQGRQTEDALLIPEDAVQRQGTELVVFVEEGSGRYERREVQTGVPQNGLIPVHSGLTAGERVVSAGAFALLSELAKAGFEVHNH